MGEVDADETGELLAEAWRLRAPNASPPPRPRLPTDGAEPIGPVHPRAPSVASMAPCRQRRTVPPEPAQVLPAQQRRGTNAPPQAVHAQLRWASYERPRRPSACNKRWASYERARGPSTHNRAGLLTKAGLLTRGLRAACRNHRAGRSHQPPLTALRSRARGTFRTGAGHLLDPRRGTSGRGCARCYRAGRAGGGAVRESAEQVVIEAAGRGPAGKRWRRGGVAEGGR